MLAPVIERQPRGRAAAVDDRQFARRARHAADDDRRASVPCRQITHLSLYGVERQWISTWSPGCSDSHGTCDGVA